MPYLSRMLIRAAALSLSLAACGFASDPGSAVSERTAEVDQTLCSGDDGDGDCLPDSTVEEVWCANHPDELCSPSTWCGPTGTRCGRPTAPRVLP